MADSSSADGNTNGNDEPKVIRYSKEFLLSLHDSPLAVKPDNFPGLSLWFGEDWQNVNTKGVLNGSSSPKTLDKNIVLGPPKTSFNSSVFGGLKQSDDTGVTGKSSGSHATHGTRMRHEGRASRDSANNDMRSQRNSHNLTERSFVRDRNGSSDRGFRNNGDKVTADPQARNPRSRPNDRFGDRNPEMQRNRRESHRDNNANRNQKGRLDHVEGTPEWMDYDPEAENSAKNKNVDGKDKEPEFINDLEAWKSKMKQQDKTQSRDIGNDSKHVKNDSDINVKTAESSAPVVEQLQGTKGQANDNVDDMFAHYSHNLADTTMAFDNFGLNESNSGLSSPASIGTSNKGGSRFAKFFSSKQQDGSPSTPPAQEEHVSSRSDTTPKSISLDTLFQSQSGSPEVQRPRQPPTMGGRRMLSENDILQSLGANNAQPAQSDSVNDAAGFNKVLEALSKSKPQVMQSPQGASHIENRNPSDEQLRRMGNVQPMMGNSLGMQTTQQPSIPMNANSIPMGHDRPDVMHMQQRMQATDSSPHQQRRQHEAGYSPNMRGPAYVDLAHNSPGRQRVNSQNSPSQRPRMVASNLPTSVLRQLSAKSSESPGKSPSPNVNKQQASYSPSQARNMPAGQYPQHPDQPGYGYNSVPMYQQARPPPVAGGFPGSFMEMGGPNMTVEQMMQMRNGIQGSSAPPQPSSRGNMPPMPVMGNMPPYPYMMGNSPGAMQGPPPGPHGYPADMRPPPKEHYMGILPGANMPNAGGVPPQFLQQGPAGNGMGMNRMMPPNFDGYERNYGGKP